MRPKPNKYLEPQIFTFTITKILGKRVIFKKRSFFHITTTLMAKIIGNRAMTI